MGKSTEPKILRFVMDKDQRLLPSLLYGSSLGTKGGTVSPTLVCETNPGVNGGTVSPSLVYDSSLEAKGATVATSLIYDSSLEAREGTVSPSLASDTNLGVMGGKVSPSFTYDSGPEAHQGGSWSPSVFFDSSLEEGTDASESTPIRHQNERKALQERYNQISPTALRNLNKAKTIGFVAMSYENTKKKRKKTKFERKRSKVGSIGSNDVEFSRNKADQDSEDSTEDIFGSLVSMVTVGRGNNCIRKRSFRHVKKCIEDDCSNVNRTNKQGMFPLHISAQLGYLDIVQLLLDNGADVDIATKNEGSTSLHVCSKFNHIEVARALILHGCNVDAIGTNGDTALHIACTHGYLEIAKLLLDSGASVNLTNEDQQTALHRSSIHGSVEMMRLLISRGADILSKDCNRNTPLIFACLSGHLKLADILIAHAAEHGFSVPDYLSKQNIRGETALHAGTTKRHTEIVQMLLQKGSDVTSVKVNGQSALHIAAMNGSRDIARNLISHGALLTLADNDNMSPLHRAALHNQVETMKLLLQEGCPPDICDEDSFTPLMCAAWKGNCEAGGILLKEGSAIETLDYNQKNCLHLAVEMDHVEFVKMLLRHVNSVNIINATSKMEWTPLHYAAENGNVEIMRCLLDAGANLTCKDHQVKSPLHIAASHGKLKFTAAALHEQPDTINESDRRGMTPLLLASKHGHHHVVRYLLKTGADISSRNSHEMTALSLAAMKGNVHVISVLLQFHSNVNAQDKDWNTPLHICCIYNQDDAAHLLLHANANFCILNRKRHSVLDLAANYKREAIAAAILNNKKKGVSEMNINCIVTYDFKYLDPGPDDVSTLKQKKRYFALNVGNIARCVNCLDHLQRFIEHDQCQIIDNELPSASWDQGGCPVFNESDPMIGPHINRLEVRTNHANTSNVSNAVNEKNRVNVDSSHTEHHGCIYIAVERLDFCMDLSNWNDLIAFTATLIFILPPGRVPCAFQWNCGVLGILLSYLRFITLLQRLDYVGIYVTMFWTTVKSLLKAMAVYVLFMIAFAFTFRITFGKQIGISIGDIEAIRASSDIKRMSLQVDVTYSLESKLPVFLQRKVYSATYVDYPNKPRLGLLTKVRHFLIGEPSSGFLSDEVTDDNSLNESIGDIKNCVDTQKDL
nr:transient receptor potential cation channel subfamily A member 3 [Apostichopus japonicus]